MTVMYNYVLFILDVFVDLVYSADKRLSRW